MKRLALAAVALGLATGAAAQTNPTKPTKTATCRTGKGKFVKCPKPAPTKSMRCKGASGKFVTCLK